MNNTTIAASAASARKRLASSLAALPKDPPPAVLTLGRGLARAMEPLVLVERGTGDPTLLFRACAVLQETLGATPSVDQSYPGVADATAAIAQSLEVLFAAIKAHGLVDPSTARVASTTAPAPQTPARAAQAVPSTRSAGRSTTRTSTTTVPAKRASAKARASRPTVFPQTAAKVPVGPHGLPRIEAEVDALSDTNFFTNVVGDIRDHGGIFVATYAVLAVHTPCEVGLKFPGDYVTEFLGVVKWRRNANAESTLQPGIGVEITEASDEVWALIARFIKKREPIVQDT